MSTQDDVRIVRDLAKHYADIAAKPVQNERRRLWSDHNSLRPTRPLVLATYGMWNVWCREVFGDHALLCQEPFYREIERSLRMSILHDQIGDDFIIEPWYTVAAVQKTGWNNVYGPEIKHENAGVEGGAWHFDPVIKDWSDVSKLSWPVHQIDEAETARRVARTSEAIGDILTVNLDRGPACRGFMADLSTHLVQLRGLEQMMIDMYESPEELHRLIAWARDGVLANQAAAEAAGDIGLAAGENQYMTYAHELPSPAPNERGIKRSRLWAFCAAQEFTLISPAQHEEFLLQYQRPIVEAWGLSAYGCCEDLTTKIDMLRSIKNLRTIAVTPRADVRKCAQQIGRDYCVSWRPNPTDMVCYGFDEQRIRRIITEGLGACRGCYTHIHLKDIETVEGDVSRLWRWVRIVRDVIDSIW